MGLRIGVKNGGCAGMEYTMEWAKEQKPFDEVVEQDGAKVLIEAKALMFLLGTQMDYQTGILKVWFRVQQSQPDFSLRLWRERGNQTGGTSTVLSFRRTEGFLPLP